MPVNDVVQVARRLIEDCSGHRVISVYLDLDPERFATAPARASQVRSLVDEARKALDDDSELDHEERIALRRDVERIDSYLRSGDPPFRGARALALFCSAREQLFETVRMPRPVPGRVVIATKPYVEPLIAALAERRWMVVLVSRRTARLLTGAPETLAEQGSFPDDVHGQHDQGGWSQARYERSVEKEADDHLRRVAHAIERLWRRERYDRLAVGGPQEIVPRFEGMLSDELRSRLAGGRVDVDVSSAGEEQIGAVVGQLAEEDARQSERAALDRLAAGIGSGGRGAGGPEQTLEALNERRVQTLLLEPAFDRPAQRCPACGLLRVESGDGRCPVDGTALEEVDHLREAAVESALAQDAEVTVVRFYPDLGPHQGIGALLRF